MTRKRTNPDFLNGVPELLILRLLSRQPMHGYQIVEAIRQSTHAELEFGEGCIYPLLHRLEADGFLTGKRETVAGRDRVVYRVTRSGAKRLVETTASWRQVVDAVQHVLQDSPHVRPSLA
jgi:PadR family transcriptional regulator, regulatory protein PadR